MKHRVILIRPILILLLLSFTVRSEEPGSITLTTESGEIITGTVQSNNGEQIVLKFENLGVLTLPANAVFHRDEPKAAVAAPPKSKQDLKSAPDSSATKQEPKKGAVRSFLRLPDEVSVATSMGTSFLSGQTKGDTVDGKLTIGYEKGRYRGSMMGQYRYGKFGGRRVTDEHQLMAQVFRYFGEHGADKEKRKYFAILQNLYEVNTIRSIKFDYDFLAGLGVDLHKNEKSNSLIAAGFNGEIESLSGINAPDPMRTEVARAYIYSQLNWQFSQRVSFQSSVGYQVRPSDTSDYELQFYSTAKYSLAPRLSLDLNYSYLFDDIPLDAISADTSRLSLALSYQL